MHSKCVYDGKQKEFFSLELHDLMIILMFKEPNWNPAMEAQAVDCLYRLGQTSQVFVYRYYVRGTLEMNIHQVKSRKGELAL